MPTEPSKLMSEAAPDAAACSLVEGEVRGKYWRWCPRCHYFMSCSDFD
jgi:hypothetical protein